MVFVPRFYEHCSGARDKRCDIARMVPGPEPLRASTETYDFKHGETLTPYLFQWNELRCPSGRYQSSMSVGCGVFASTPSINNIYFHFPTTCTLCKAQQARAPQCHHRSTTATMRPGHSYVTKLLGPKILISAVNLCIVRESFEKGI